MLILFVLPQPELLWFLPQMLAMGFTELEEADGCVSLSAPERLPARASPFSRSTHRHRGPSQLNRTVSWSNNTA